MTNCEVCGEPAVDVHHILYQSNANEFGHIESIHKNMQGNLCNLCEDCHKKEHNNTINIKGYKDTTEGPELIIEKTNSTTRINKKKYSQDEINWILNSYNLNNKRTHKQICSMFEDVYKKKISTGIVGKILNNKY